MKNILLLILLSLLAGCSQSLVYSPSLNLPAKPLKEKEIDLQGGMELMPEARPEALTGAPTTLGLSGQIGYGFSNAFNLAVKGWVDVEGRETRVRYGYSLNGQFLKPLGQENYLIVIPRAGIAFWGNEVQGYGIGASILYHQELGRRMGWYIAGGILWGFKDLDKAGDRIPMGFGIASNLGIAWEIAPRFRFNAELCPLYQINTFDETQQFIFTPHIGVGYTIR